MSIKLERAMESIVRESPSTESLNISLLAYDWYLGFVTAGFNTDQALSLVTEMLKQTIASNIATPTAPTE